jgi:hypothetical protein
MCFIAAVKRGECGDLGDIGSPTPRAGAVGVKEADRGRALVSAVTGHEVTKDSRLMLACFAPGDILAAPPTPAAPAPSSEKSEEPNDVAMEDIRFRSVEY